MIPLTDIFCNIDDFCKDFETAYGKNCLPDPNRKRKRSCSLSISEVITIEVLFHLSHYRTFKDYYTDYVNRHWKQEFPGLVSYNRFVELKASMLIPLLGLSKKLSGRKTGKYYIDSSKLEVCHNLRIRRNKVFKGLATRGKTSTGWFYGFKLHFTMNDQGELMSFCLTQGNVDDRKPVEQISQGLQGWMFGDKGYISKELAESLYSRGLALFTKVRRNMKQTIMNSIQKFYLDKRGVIETAIDQLKSICQIQHTRHRSPNNFVINLIAGLVAYSLKPLKPCVIPSYNNKKSNMLMPN